MGKRKKNHRTQTTAMLPGVPADPRNVRSVKAGVMLLKCFMALVPFLIGLGYTLATGGLAPTIVGLAVGLILAFNTTVVLEWENALVMRLGKLNRVKGPGVLFTIPFVEFVGGYVDQRLNATTFRAEKTLTADCMPVDVDAVLFWMVWDAKSAVTEVHNYRDAVFWAAQTTLRDAIGNVTVAELSTRRRALDAEIKQELEKKTETWGVTVSSVEIRDIVIPEALQDAVSKEAQAERERNARVTLAEAEEDISEMFVRAKRNYASEEGSMDLRAMNMLYDGIKEQGGLVLLPSSLADAFAKAAQTPADNTSAEE